MACDERKQSYFYISNENIKTCLNHNVNTCLHDLLKHNKTCLNTAQNRIKHLKTH